MNFIFIFPPLCKKVGDGVKYTLNWCLKDSVQRVLNYNTSLGDFSLHNRQQNHPPLIELDKDHPGFQDKAYRKRRDLIAEKAYSFNMDEKVPRVEYTEEEHQMWSEVLTRLSPLHKIHACQYFLEALGLIELNDKKIPQLCDINILLKDLSGFQMVPVAGLISPEHFLLRLADKTFSSTQYIRHHSRPFYTPEPDIIHELVGHSVTLAHPFFSDLNFRFGLAAQRAKPESFERLIQAYWYTLEFGLVQENGEIKAYGAGLLSSIGEMPSYESEAKLYSFDMDKISKTQFDPTDYQPGLFVAPSTEELQTTLNDWLENFE